MNRSFVSKKRRSMCGQSDSPGARRLSSAPQTLFFTFYSSHI
jgi:hypothetical protein